MSNDNIINDLVEMNADAWNKMTADKLGMDVNMLRDHYTLRQSLSQTEKKSKILIDKKIKIDLISRSMLDKENSFKWASDNSTVLYIPPSDRFVEEINTKTENTYSAVCFYGKILVGFDFSNSELESSFFSGCIFFNCSFNGVNFDDAIFTNCIFNICDFSNANMYKSKLIKCRVLDCVFDRVNAPDLMLIDTILISSQFIHCILPNSVSIGSGSVDCDFQGSSMQGMQFITSSTIGCQYSDVDLQKSKFIDSALIRCDLMGANIYKTSINLVSTSGVLYDGEYTDLFGSDLPIPSTHEYDLDSDVHDDESIFGDDDDDDDMYPGDERIEY